MFGHDQTSVDFDLFHLLEKIILTASFLNLYNPLERIDFYFRLAASSILPISTNSECVYGVGNQVALIDTDERKMCMPCPTNFSHGSK